MNVSTDRLKHANLLMTDENIPDHEVPDKQLSQSDNNLPVPSIIKNEQLDLPDKNVEEKTTRSGRHVRLLKRYRD